MTLSARDVTWSVGGRLIVGGVSLDPAPGSTVGLLGPNGSGKSSLLRVLAGLRRPDDGVVELDGEPLTSLRRREVARRVAVVEQETGTEQDLLVGDVVALGRIPHHRPGSGTTADDDAAVRRAAEHADVADRLDRPYRTLSGGERQRVQIARALAQEPTDLLLDEPTNHLDVSHQLDLLALVRRTPVTTVVALHDLNLAAMFCDQVVVLRDGRALAAGRPADVLDPRTIADVYGVRAVVEVHGGITHVRYLPPPG